MHTMLINLENTFPLILIALIFLFLFGTFGMYKCAIIMDSIVPVCTPKYLSKCEELALIVSQGS